MIRTKQFFEDNGFTLEVETTPRCNLKCEYCENRMSDDGSIPGKDLNLDSLAAFIHRSFSGRKLTVLLNGGEPTLNLDLKRFCRSILQEKFFSIVLYSNMTACRSLYMNLKDLGVIIKSTFHGTVKDAAVFRKKLDDYQITEPVLVPCSKDNIQNINQLKSILGEIQLILLENKTISPIDVMNLVKVDESIKQQFRILVSSSNRFSQEKHCGKKYVYVDGNGDVCQCVFLLQKRVLGNIYNESYSFTLTP